MADTIARAGAYAERARAALAPFTDGVYRRALAEIADFAVRRAY